MARFTGEVGYASETVETPPGSGNWKAQITEYPYSGDVIRNARSLDSGDKVNDDFHLAASISVVADQFAFENFANIKYVRYMGALWTVTSVAVQRPRLILTIGSVYNGPTA